MSLNEKLKVFSCRREVIKARIMKIKLSEIFFDVLVVLISILMWLGVRTIYVEKHAPAEVVIVQEEEIPSLQINEADDEVDPRVKMPLTMGDKFEDLMRIVLYPEVLSQFEKVVKETEIFDSNPVLGDVMNWWLE